MESDPKDAQDLLTSLFTRSFLASNMNGRMNDDEVEVILELYCTF